jgi:hypothetical protein
MDPIPSDGFTNPFPLYKLPQQNKVKSSVDLHEPQDPGEEQK